MMDRDTLADRGAAKDFVMLPAGSIGFLMYSAARELVAQVPPANDRIGTR